MKYTQNLNLKKPDFNESVLITDINENMEIIDEAINELQKGTESIPIAINEIDKKATSTEKELTQHLADNMPHTFIDNGVKYRWGFRTFNGEPQFIYEEVV